MLPLVSLKIYLHKIWCSILITELNKDLRTKKTPQAEKYRLLYHKFQFLRYVALFLYVLISFFEVPNWCMDNEEITDHIYCDNDIYPNSGLPKLHYIIAGFLEILFLSILLFFTLFRKTFKVASKKSKTREVIHSTLTFIAIIDILISMILYKAPMCSNFVKIIIIVLFIRSLRECISRIIMVVYDSKEILMLMVGYVLFFGWVGARLFRGTIEGEKYFTSLWDGIFNLTVLLTTANFPDIMLPAYKSNQAYCLFFIIYLTMGVFFMMNLILATFYSNYKNRVERTLNDFMVERKDYLISKFNQYDYTGRGFLTLSEFKTLVCEFVRFNKNDKDPELDSQKISEMFDPDNQGKITLHNFIKNFDICDLKDICSDEIKVKDHSNKSNAIRTIKRVLKHPFYECTVCIFIMLNFLLVFQIDWMEVYGSDKTMIINWVYFQACANLFYLIELIVYCYSFKSYPFLKLELYLQVINFLTCFNFFVFDKLELEIKALEISVIVRAIRLLNLLKEIKQFKIIIDTINALLAPFYILLLVIFMLFLMFATIGDKLFGGLANLSTFEIFRDQSVPDIYVVLNFNDLASSFVTLFSCMVVSNWYIIVQVYVNVSGSKNARWFFVFFYICCVIVMLNIIVAFAIDMYQCVEAINSNKTKGNNENSDDSEDSDQDIFSRDPKKNIRLSKKLIDVKLKDLNKYENINQSNNNQGRNINTNEIEIPIENSNFPLYTPRLSSSKKFSESFIPPKFSSKLSCESIDDEVSHKNTLSKAISNQLRNFENSSLSDKHGLSVLGHSEFTFNEESKISGIDSIAQEGFEQINEEDEKEVDNQSIYTFGKRELKANEVRLINDLKSTGKF